ncbi:MAG TPA: DUF1614 domain-containing protein [Deltaproteobacteria bacterium]|jgi:uncharacterized membrane protein|nr:DUF1614 domain-containing protein [Deltaproteobacteria bacterium]
MHYFPITMAFLLFLALLFIFLIIAIEVGMLSYAYRRMGVDRRYVFSLLILSLLGSYINIPLFQLPPEQIVSNSYVDFFGIRHIIPLVQEWPATIIAVNIGGAVIPTILSLYLMLKNKLYSQSLVSIAVVTTLVYFMAHPVRGVGITVPTFIPPVAATAAALIFSSKYAPALAYICGTMGTLLGADILHLPDIRGLGAPVASIGGAGTFDGIFVTGILAVLLASVMTGKAEKTS